MISFFGVPSTIYPCSNDHAYIAAYVHVCEFLCCKKLLLIKKVMSEELIYIINGKKSNGNKRKNLLGKNERIGLRKKGTETRPV